GGWSRRRRGGGADPSPLPGRGQERIVAERAAGDRTRHPASELDALPPDLIRVFFGTPAKDGGDGMTGGGEFLDEPGAGEGTPAREKDLHLEVARSHRKKAGPSERALVGVLCGKQRQ